MKIAGVFFEMRFSALTKQSALCMVDSISELCDFVPFCVSL